MSIWLLGYLLASLPEISWSWWWSCFVFPRLGILPVDFFPDSFKYLYASLCVNGVAMRLVVIYRPHLLVQTNSWLTPLDSAWLLLPHPSKLLVVGDFNIHVDSESIAFGQKFLSLVESCDLFHYVSESTHPGGHTLDLVLSRGSII